MKEPSLIQKIEVELLLRNTNLGSRPPQISKDRNEDYRLQQKIKWYKEKETIHCLLVFVDLIKKQKQLSKEQKRSVDQVFFGVEFEIAKLIGGVARVEK